MFQGNNLSLPKNERVMSIVTNPFIASGKIPAELFCDRKDESKRLIQSLTNGANVVLMSPRRVGKTQLIYHCFDKPEIKDHYITIFVDILRTSSFQEFTYEFGKAVFNTLATKGQKMQKLAIATMKSLMGNITIDPATMLPTFGLAIGNIQNPAYSLEEIFRTLELAGKKCIVAIDEFQQITNYPEKNIEAILRTHIQELSNSLFIFAGSERQLLEEMFLESSRPFYNSADIQSIDIIAEEKYSEFVQYHFNKNDKKIANDTISHVYHLFEGNTYYNQKTFREAFAQTAQGETCSLETVDNSINLMIKEADHLYSEKLSRLSLPQKELLYAIANEGRAQKITSGAFIRKHQLSSTSSVQQAIKKLLALGLVSTSSNEYFIADQLMYLWLRK
jgi:AAA+ ATPase superfamily predicted ATPase